MAKLNKVKHNRVVTYLAIVIILIALFFSLTTKTFFSWNNLFDILGSYAVTGIFAMGLLVVLITGGIDISFLATASVVQYLTVKICFSLGISDYISLGVIVALAIGIIIGIINGLLIYKLKIVSIIATISMQGILFGFLMYTSGGRIIYNLPEWMYDYGGTIYTLEIGGDTIPLSLAPFIMIFAALFTWFLLNKTTLGRQLYAMGGNAEAARRLGISLSFLYVFAYGYMGLMAAIGGLTQVLRVQDVVPNALVGKELDVLAAAVLGGGSFAGGRGSVVGAIMGVFLIGLLKNGLNLLGVSSYFSDTIVGPVIIMALIATHVGKRKETDVGFA